MTEKIFKKQKEFDDSVFDLIRYFDNKTETGKIGYSFDESGDIHIDMWENIVKADQTKIISSMALKNPKFSNVISGADK